METECEPDILEMWLYRVPLPNIFRKGNPFSPTSCTLCLSFLYSQHLALCWAHSTCLVNICDLLNTCQVQSKDPGQTGLDKPGSENKKSEETPESQEPFQT